MLVILGLLAKFTIKFILAFYTNDSDKILI